MLFHGSLHKFKKIKKNQAQGLNVPEKELLDAIYLSPDFGFALAMGVSALVGGKTQIDDEKKIIEFEKTKDLNPKSHVYIYEIDEKDIPEEKLIRIDERQIAVLQDELTPVSIKKVKVKELFKYYRIKK